MPDTTDTASLLREAGLRVTRQRVAVLEEVARNPHTDADAVLGAVQREHGPVSRQAVYDVLAALTGADLVRRIEPAGSPALYEPERGDNHHHLVCRRCGAVADVPCALGDTPCLEPALDHGYVVDEAEIVFWGTCPACHPSTEPVAPARGGDRPASPTTRSGSP